MVHKSQPAGLYVLFFAEAWERFSYYGMRALLILYLVNHLKFERTDALAIYATYTGLVYFTPMIGGYLADKYLGARKAVLIGGLIMALGHLAMAVESLLYTALGLLIVGNGFFKPNISTIVGGLYEENDPRRDGGFTIFYMGINFGAFFSPLVCGTLGEKFGWDWGFSAAGVGMIFGLLVFMAGQRLLGLTGFPPGREVTPETRLNRKDWRDIAAITTICTLLVVFCIYMWHYIGPIWNPLSNTLKTLVVAGIIMAAELSRRIFCAKNKNQAPDESLTIEEWQRIGVICILASFVIFFWMGFEQAGGTMTLFADKQTRLNILGYQFPASYFQSVNPLAIMILAPVFSIFWTRLDESRFKLSTPAKMAFGLIILGLGFIVMSVAQGFAKNGLVSPLWLASVYLIHTVAELCLSPIGLSMVTKLSPTHLVALMMGVWFISTSVANYMAGRLEAIISAYNVPVFDFLIYSSITAGVLLLLITPKLNKWTHNRC